MQDLRQAKINSPAAMPTTKMIHIGWKMKFDPMKPYKLRKRMDGGGNYDCEIDLSKKYSVDDIIQIGLKNYTSDFAKFLLDNSTTKLGFYNNTVIEKFILPNGKDCSILEYFQSR